MFYFSSLLVCLVWSRLALTPMQEKVKLFTSIIRAMNRFYSLDKKLLEKGRGNRAIDRMSLDFNIPCSCWVNLWRLKLTISIWANQDTCPLCGYWVVLCRKYWSSKKNKVQLYEWLMNVVGLDETRTQMPVACFLSKNHSVTLPSPWQ